MVVPAITNQSGVIFSFNDGDADDIVSNSSAELDFDAMPGMVATSAMLYDFNGVKKVIEVNGELTNSGTNRLSSGSAITLDEQRKWLELNMNGSQGTSYFSSTYTSSWNGSSWIASPILYSNVVFNEKAGKPNSLPFKLVLLVGGL